jgi:hypothetical protein
MSQQPVSANTIPKSAVAIFSPKTEGKKTKAARVLIRWLPRKFRSLYFAHKATFESNKVKWIKFFLKTPQRLNPK